MAIGINLKFLSRSTPIEIGTYLTDFEIVHFNQKTKSGKYVTYVTAIVPDGTDFLLLFHSQSDLMSYVRFLDARKPGSVISKDTTVAGLGDLGTISGSLNRSGGSKSGKSSGSRKVDAESGTSKTVRDAIEALSE